MPTTHTLRKILIDTQCIAIVGLSAKWHRPSFFVAKYFLDHGYTVIPVNPNYEEILGQKCYATLADIPVKVGMVDLFQRSETAPEYAQQAIEIGANVLWLQLGIVSTKARNISTASGLEFVQDKCIKIEHARIFGGLNFIGVDTKIISSKRNKLIDNASL